MKSIPAHMVAIGFFLLIKYVTHVSIVPESL